ncbi:protease modulator HflK N-terminal domain-containing protein, partial [Klebsiella pneumoniae]|uniref:protease modulator HflK N-terminal domain-containing protein n=1 Tax=Klebsiella pneumoniae TaxID=573 RepID=UPI003CC9219D
MAWKNQGGGPWGSGPKGPWGQGPQSVGPRPPDLEDLLRRGQDKMQQLLPGGRGPTDCGPWPHGPFG